MIHRYLIMMMMITRFYPLLKDPQTSDDDYFCNDITSYAKLKFEYYILDEETGDETQPNVNDDQMLLQLQLSF